HVAGRNAEPTGQRCGKFVHARRGNPAPVLGIIGTVNRQCGECAVKFVPAHCTAQYKLVTAPTVVASASIAGECSPEIRSGECSHRLIYAELDRCRVKG